MNNSKYFTTSENLKIDSFIQIPKILFKNPKYANLSLTSRLIYSLYLNRYSNTKYKDDFGPYIIFGDKELEEFLAITKPTCVRCKKQLLEHNLIYIQKGTGFNKIYIKNYRNPDIDEFYYEQDLENFAFYRFPRVFFEEEFDELSLNAKFLYTYYFDWMCLSQMNYVVDNYSRIYFTESERSQEDSLLLNKDTIRTARKQLIAADLLIGYKNYGKTKNYYLLKLANYNHKQLIEYNIMPSKEKNAFIKNIDNLNSTIIQVPKANIRTLRKNSDKTVKDMIDYLNTKGFTVSPRTYNRYETGTRKCPKEIYQEIVDYLKKSTKDENLNLKKTKKDHNNGNFLPRKTEKNTIIPKKLIIQKEKNDTQKNQEKNFDKTNFDVDLLKNEKNFNNTKNYNNKQLNKNIINFISNSLNNISKIKKDMIINSFNYLILKRGFYLKNEKIDLDKCMYLLETLKDYNPSELEDYFLKVIDRMSTYKHNFKSNDSVMNYFLTFVLNDLVAGKEEIDKYVKKENQWISIWDTEEQEIAKTKKTNAEDVLNILKQFE